MISQKNKILLHFSFGSGIFFSHKYHLLLLRNKRFLSCVQELIIGCKMKINLSRHCPVSVRNTTFEWDPYVSDQPVNGKFILFFIILIFYLRHYSAKV